MPALDPVENFVTVTVNQGYDDSATSIELYAGDGAKLPTIGAGEGINGTWYNDSDSPDVDSDDQKEVIRCTVCSGDTLTIGRAQEGTSAQNHNTAAKTYKIRFGITKRFRDEIVRRALGCSAAHAAATGNTVAISSGAVDITGLSTSYVHIASEVDGSDDDLDEITGTAGQIIVITPRYSDEVITVKHLGTKFRLSGDKDFKMMYDDRLVLASEAATRWVELGRHYEAGNVQAGASTELTIASGSISVQGSSHTVDGEGDAADNLVYLAGGNDGMIVTLSIVASARAITVIDSTGFGADEIVLNGSANWTMSSIYDTLTLQRRGTLWVEIGRSDRA